MSLRSLPPLPPMNAGSICWAREHIAGMSFNDAHRWETVFWSGPYPITTFDSVVCTVCGVNGWRER